MENKITLVSLVEEQIYTFMCETGKYHEIIIMHPYTWENLCKEIFNSDSIAINRHDPSLSYKGVKVVRSLDLVENSFIIK